jgi:hypothetical protein
MRRLLVLLCWLPALTWAQVNAGSDARSLAASSASNQGNSQTLVLQGTDKMSYGGSYDVRTVGNAVLPGFSGSFSTDYCGATAGGAGGGIGFSISIAAPKIDPSCVLLRTFERTMQAAAHTPDPQRAGLIREAALEILAEVDPMVKTIYARKGLLGSSEAANP